MLKKVSLLHFAQYIKNIWRVPDGKGVLGFFSLYVGGGGSGLLLWCAVKKSVTTLLIFPSLIYWGYKTLIKTFLCQKNQNIYTIS